MGTRNLTVVEIGGECKVAQYGQWDGYPSGQGIRILNFLRSPESVEDLKGNLKRTRFVDAEKDKKWLEEYDKNAPEWSNEPDNRTDEQKHWWETYMIRDLGAGILTNIANSEDEEILLIDRSSFASDSLFCEWAYVVDFDSGVFEVYVGFQEHPHEDGRFCKMPPGENGYHPIKLVKTYQLDNLPDNETFLKDFEELE